MSKKTKIFLVVEIIVAILIIGGAIFFVTYKPKEQVEHLTKEEKEQQAIDRANNQLREKQAKKEESEKRYENAVKKAEETEQNLREAEMQTYEGW